eukprot:3704702-Rhodomonas_salina.1
MTPFANALNNSEHLFNHCFSSTLFYVEQAFGWWKNRWLFLIRASMLSHADQCLFIYATMVHHNICVVCDENKQLNWDLLLGQTTIDGNGCVSDVELTAWYASHEKVMCAECSAAVPQCLYCVHADHIAQEDMQLAQANGREHGQHLPPIRSNELHSLARSCNAIADQLWR